MYFYKKYIQNVTEYKKSIFTLNKLEYKYKS